MVLDGMKVFAAAWRSLKRSLLPSAAAIPRSRKVFTGADRVAPLGGAGSSAPSLLKAGSVLQRTLHLVQSSVPEKAVLGNGRHATRGSAVSAAFIPGVKSGTFKRSPEISSAERLRAAAEKQHNTVINVRFSVARLRATAKTARSPEARQNLLKMSALLESQANAAETTMTKTFELANRMKKFENGKLLPQEIVKLNSEMEAHLEEFKQVNTLRRRNSR